VVGASSPSSFSDTQTTLLQVAVISVREQQRNSGRALKITRELQRSIASHVGCSLMQQQSSNVTRPHIVLQM
jgi:hypothetical protein